MARLKKKSPDRKSSAEKDDSTKKNGKDPKRANQDGWRETFESVVVAFVLAFLFRAFEAEAFVIPTGSMAPTLFGRHKECVCEMCQYRFVFGASDEIEEDTGGYFQSGKRITRAICPNCRFENDVENLPVFKGDRILVNKFPYEFGDPKRWDVPVFKYPERPTTNYIKRMVGMPNETLVISGGNLFREEERALNILRMPPDKQWRLQIPVYNNNYPETPLHEHGWPKRWAAVERDTSAAGDSDAAADSPDGPLVVDGWVEARNSWQEDAESHSFLIEEATSKENLKWLRYRHIVPDFDDWAAVTGEGRSAFADDQPGELEKRPRPKLIADFCGYNSYRGGNNTDPDNGAFWVGDLTVSFVADLRSANDGSELVIELNEGDQRFRVRIDVATGKGRLLSVLSFAGDEENLLAEADTGLHGTGEYDVRFANVDDRLCLWIDGDLVDFGEEAAYSVDKSELQGPLDADLIPVGIAAQNLTVQVSDLIIERDIYYQASQAPNGARSPHDARYEHPYEASLRELLSNPAEWYRVYQSESRESRFELGPDEYLMLGDNSPRSQDSRVWTNIRGAVHRHAVPRSALVGRAFYIYWPHGIPFLNDGQGFPVTYHNELTHEGVRKTDYADFRLPFYPNFCRMQRIR